MAGPGQAVVLTLSWGLMIKPSCLKEAGVSVGIKAVGILDELGSQEMWSGA